MSCFMGYIELFDSIEFQSKGKWDNQIVQQKEPTQNVDKKEAKPIGDFLSEQEQKLLGKSDVAALTKT